MCVSYLSADFDALSSSEAGKRLSKVIYDTLLQERIIDHILNEGWRHYNTSNSPSVALEATVAALIFMMPVMKHEGFKEEHEWRFIYLPEVEDPTVSNRKFFVRSNMLIPYYTLLDADPNKDNLPYPQEIMVGPSAHQNLNFRSLEYIRNHTHITPSKIPYRG